MKNIYKFVSYLHLKFLFFKQGINRRIARYSILTNTATIDAIIQQKLSISRYGDGEFDIMGGGGNGFQNSNPELALRLKEILANPISQCLVCIPKDFQQIGNQRYESQLFSYGYLVASFARNIEPYLNPSYQYGDTNFTRFYMMRKEKTGLEPYVLHLKQIWKGRKLLMVEGEKSRLGVGNDLFANSAGIRRILCPLTCAFDRYNDILSSVKHHHQPDELILIALGMTATVLAYDLAKEGRQAIDVGHVDVEYEYAYGCHGEMPCP